MSETPRRTEYSMDSMLYLALELGEAKWNLG
jgi:hypothetical protein